MRRIFWMAVGAGATVWAMNKANEAARRLTPASLAGTAARGALDLGDAVRSFAGEVRAGMAERELELRADLGLDGTAVLPPPPPRRALGAPSHPADEYRAIAPAPGLPGAGPVRRLDPQNRQTPSALETTPDPHEAGLRGRRPRRGSTHNRKDH
ncbi:DUF6167 family protein [Streptacidiphilus sp. ASG 303]|uniref:DUF6167 family protein n=1 Tax=Streptacidiphilus sp. ASG 303 TaxID=2896847 RepID=UPI001E3AE367|nr:DUF6167 family protein [Streptacidiphilus sp. ASG 303]MCD0481212.1 DUF6167 family protein [Streptacidiphilus sp. ASG 303]